MTLAAKPEGWYARAAARHRENPACVAEVDRVAKRARAGDSRAVEELAELLGGIADALGARFSRAAYVRNLPAEDLGQEAMLAMLKGLERWKPEESSFRAFAFLNASYAVLDAINNSFVVSVNKTTVDRVLSGRPDADAKKYLSDASRANAERAMNVPTSLDAPRAADQEGAAYDSLGGSEDEDYAEAERSLLISQILGAAALTQREEAMLRARYRLDDPGSRMPTLRELGAAYGMTPQRAGQVLWRAVNKLRRAT